MNSNFSSPAVVWAMRPNFVKFWSSPYTMMPAWWYWAVPSKLSFAVATQSPPGISRVTRFAAVLVPP